MNIDPVTLEILDSALRSASEEMAVVEYRSSFSPVIREMLDYNCAIFDENGRVVAHSETIPALLGVMQFALQHILENHEGPLADGDVMLLNHPYRGGTHTPDLQVFRPAYKDGVLIGYAGSIAHHIDVGGRLPGSESARNTEVFQEGLMFPGIKLVDAGVRNAPLYELIAANVRDPHATVGDLDAQLAACARGVERLDDLCERYGIELVKAGMERVNERTAQRVSAIFSEWSGEQVESVGYLDDDGHDGGDPVAIRVKLQVVDGVLEVDLTGTDDQVDAGINVPVSSAHSAAYYAVRCFLDEGISQNAGLSDRIRLSTRPGSLVDPLYPAAVSARHLAVQRLADVVIQGMCELCPERAVAASHASFPNFVFQAHDERVGKTTVFTDMLGGGTGARPDAPGDDAVDAYTSNCALMPAEVIELEYPWRVERSALVPGSGGTGRHRGGLALHREYRLLAEKANGMYYSGQADPRFGAAGREGGGPGGPAEVRLRTVGDGQDKRISPKGDIELERGDVITFISAGGGGYGRENQGGSLKTESA